jgi:hypothetical protein
MCFFGTKSTVVRIYKYFNLLNSLQFNMLYIEKKGCLALLVVIVGLYAGDDWLEMID